jgi:mono/diheme cytochrome c family protein
MAGRVAVLLFTTGVLNAQTVDFAGDIQPVFARSCHPCHGDKLQMGQLRLDSKASAMRGGQSGKLIAAGNAAASILYQRLAGIGGQARMPMGAKPLDPGEIDRIKAWIDQGAQWPDDRTTDSAAIKKHWAFVPPQRPALPKVKAARWPANAIDRFVLARLEQEGLAPSPEADKTTLLRRLSLDLIGLPPTPGEVDAFLGDKSANAYQKQVERLLASPHYGERWARMWLDAARYADSDGFEKDKPRQVWFYRDWVIQALNRDLGYDRFIIEQIAGDLLPSASQNNRVATGFLRNSMLNEEGGIDPEQFRMEGMFDRMDAIGKGILGITIQCAQCHNHKYDPLTQQDYYRMLAFINNSHEANIRVYTPKQQSEREALLSQIRRIEENLQRSVRDWKQRMAQWESAARGNQPEWVVVRPEVEDISTGGQRYIPMPDGSLLAQGYAPTKHRVKLTFTTQMKNVAALRLELLNDPNLPLGGPGRSIKGTAALTEFEVEAAPADAGAKPVKLKVARATADIELPERELDPIFHDKSNQRRVTGPIAFAIDGKEETAWGIDAGPARRNLPRKAVFNLEQPLTNSGPTVLTVYLSQKHGGWNSDDNQNNNLGRFRLSITSDPGAAADLLPLRVRELLAVPADQRTAGQTAEVFSYWRTTVKEWAAANQKIEELWLGHPEGASQLVLQERAEIRPTHLLSRGDFLKPAHTVSPGVPSFLHPMAEGAPANRLGFAQWLVDRNSPTTARSIVNRIWQAYFGTGIIATSEDLGMQSEAPSHAELLDWLSVEFMDKGWSLKQLHRLIVLSAAYRQSSRVSEALRERDPYNRLLARGPRMRVDGEIVRDIALAVSGLLNPAIGGPSVYPPAPDFLFLPPASYGPKNWHEEKGEGRYRRALYTFRYRSVPYPMLENFDTPNGDMSCVRRPRSNTPLQALTTLNEPLFVEAAKALARTTLAEGGGTDAARIDYAFRRTVARTPTAAERAELQALLERQIQRSKDGNPHLAAWTLVARVLLNLDETITKE